MGEKENGRKIKTDKILDMAETTRQEREALLGLL